MSGFNWFFRALRLLPVVAGAALAGGALGGFAVLAVNLALTSPPNPDVHAQNKLTAAMADKTAAPAQQTTVANPVHTVEISNPNAGDQNSTPPASVVAETPAVQSQPSGVLPQQPSAFPAAPAAGTLPPVQARMNSPAPPSGPQAAQNTPAVPQPASSPPPPSAPATAAVSQPAVAAASAQASTATAQDNPPPKKQRVKVSRPMQLQPENSVADRGSPRHVYDYYDRSDQNADVETQPQPPQPHRSVTRPDNPRSPYYAVRRQNVHQDVQQDAREAGDERDVLPPQPPAPHGLFFGLFGGGDHHDYDDDRYDGDR